MATTLFEASAITATASTEREIWIQRRFDAPCERVWEALVEPRIVQQWWSRNDHLLIERLNVRRGGRWRFVDRGLDGSQRFEGRYREVTPPVRLVRTFEWSRMPGHAAVETVLLQDLLHGRTLLTTTLLFHTAYERDVLMRLGIAEEYARSYKLLDGVLKWLW